MFIWARFYLYHAIFYPKTGAFMGLTTMYNGFSYTNSMGARPINTHKSGSQNLHSLIFQFHKQHMKASIRTRATTGLTRMGIEIRAIYTTMFLRADNIHNVVTLGCAEAQSHLHLLSFILLTKIPHILITHVTSYFLFKLIILYLYVYS
jgi:hypothetical protein